MSYQSNTTVQAIAKRLLADDVRRMFLTAHAKPDGDALGSVIALARALEILGKQVERRFIPPVPRNLTFLADRAPLVLHEGKAAQHIDEPDAIVVLDTGAWSQLENLRDWLEPRHDKITVIDHHLHGDDVGKWSFVDAEAAAACELVAQLIDALGVDYDDLIGQALYLGIASDTGWFRFSNTTSRTHELAARLQREGIDHADVYMRSEQADRPQKLALMSRALNSLQLIADGKAAVMTLRRTDFQETGAGDDETERFIDIPQLVGQVKVVALIVEQDGRVRLSLRSKPAGEGAVDVNKLASQFGGGGHARAAGAKSDQPVDDVTRRVVEAIERALGDD